MPHVISLRKLTKSVPSSSGVGGRHLAVDQVNLSLREAEYLTILGPGGCGKSTLMRIVAGLERPTSGDVYMGNQRVTDMSARNREVGFVSRDPALFEHMSVGSNIAFGLKLRKVSKRERQERIGELVSLMGLEGLEEERACHLSKWQRRKVALARAVAPWPRLLLLDEPFGDLDPRARRRLWSEAKQWQRALRIPTIMSTRHPAEALALGDRVAILRGGRIEQVDTPWNVHHLPASDFVARLLGSTNAPSTDLGGNSEASNGSRRRQIAVTLERIAAISTNAPARGHDMLLNSPVAYTFLGRTVRLEVRPEDRVLATVAVPDPPAAVSGVGPDREVALVAGGRRRARSNAHV